MNNLTKKDIEESLRSVMDPELGVDIVTMGLVYKIDVKDSNVVEIDMTLTTAGCPFADEMIRQAEMAVRAIGVDEVYIDVVFDPPWEPSEELRAMFGI